MNGARGVLVAVLYKPEGESRTDALPVPTSMPHGEKHCLLPDLVIVHFPGYVGLPFLKDLPKTWVPVCCARQQRQMKKNMFHIGLPVSAGHSPSTNAKALRRNGDALSI